LLSPDNTLSRHQANWDDDGESHDSINFDKWFSIVRRQWRIVAASVVAFAIIGLVYLYTAVPLYTASTSVLMDTEHSNMIAQLSTIGAATDDEGSVLSQVELVKSETIGLKVVDKLKLGENPLIVSQRGSVIATAIKSIRSALNVSAWFSSDEPIDDQTEANRQTALGVVLGNTDVARVGRTYILDIKFTSPSPEMASVVASGIAEAYILDKLDSKYESTRRASSWLQDRIEELRQKAVDTDLAVQKFRSDNGLVTTDGKLVSDQQLTEINSAMIVAQSDTAKARARYDRIKSIVASGDADAIVTDVLDSSVSNQLRTKYLQASKLESEISARLGPDHVQAVRLRAEMKEYERLMFEELRRIAESYQSDVTVAESREKSLRDSMKAAQGVTALAGETQVHLRELERSAETYKRLHETFLTRYQEAVQEQSFPITQSRIINKASAPNKPSFPRKPLMLALFMVIGAAVGGTIGAYREFRDRFFRTGEQVREELGIEYLGSTQLVSSSKAGNSKQVEDSEHPRSIRKISGITNYVVDHPLSMFAETLRSTKIAIDFGVQHEGAKVIGFVSSLPGEGKSTVAINFAELLASQGARTLLIDCDMRNPGATRAIGRHAEAGLLETLMENRSAKDLLLVNQKTKLAFLPAVVKRRVPHSSELLSSPAMYAVLEAAKANFDYVILDLPPLGPVVDARAISPRVDAFVYIVEWGRTSRKMVRSTLFGDPEIANKCAGVILNKVDPEKMKLYRSYGSSEYYYSRYASYYRED
jgi:succinoglycan biosynthesis transport protein ExoP